MNWLERASREIGKKALGSTANTAVRRVAMAVLTEWPDAEAMREAYEERAAIMEYDAGLPRHEAGAFASAPLSAEDEAAIRAWLAAIDETDPEAIAGVIERCRQDADARDYFTRQARMLAGK